MIIHRWVDLNNVCLQVISICCNDALSQSVSNSNFVGVRIFELVSALRQADFRIPQMGTSDKQAALAAGMFADADINIGCCLARLKLGTDPKSLYF